MARRMLALLGLAGVIPAGCGASGETVEPDEAAAAPDLAAEDDEDDDEAAEAPDDGATATDADTGEATGDTKVRVSGDTVGGTFVVEQGDEEDRPDWWCLYLDLDDGTRWPFHVVASDADFIVRAEGIREYSDNPMAEPDLVLGTGERSR